MPQLIKIFFHYLNIALIFFYYDVSFYFWKISSFVRTYTSNYQNTICLYTQSLLCKFSRFISLLSSCCCCCYVASVVSNSVRPHRRQPTRLPRPWDSPGKNTGVWVAISFSSAWKWKVKVKSLSRVRLLATSWTAAYQAPLSMGFSRQEYWSGVPLPSPFLGK